MRLLIEKAFDPEQLDEIKSTALGFTHKTHKEMLDHLYGNGAKLDDIDFTNLITRMNTVQDVTKSPAKKIACDDNIEDRTEEALHHNQCLIQHWQKQL